MEKKIKIYIHLLILLILVNLSSCRNVPAIFIFGDSVFDAGNNRYIKNCSVQADFLPYGSAFFHHPTGRFTNGRTVADFISQFLGIGIQQPYLEAQIAFMNGSRKESPSNGVNFASAGSGVLPGTNIESVFNPLTIEFPKIENLKEFYVTNNMMIDDTPQGVIPIQEQLRQFQTLVEQKEINKSVVERSLFFLESGSNDIFNYFVPFTPPTQPDLYVKAMINEVANLIDQIYKVGARRIAIFSLGPVGCVPARTLLHGAPTNRCYGKMNVMVKQYNKGLEKLVNDIPKTHPGAIAVYGAIYDVVQRFRAIPNRYGFSDVNGACCGDGPLRGTVQCGKEGYKTCENPDKFLFWDYFHPTQHTYKLISKALWGGNKSRIRPTNLMTLANLTLPLV